MKEISIFVDESGDFGEYNFISPYYIVSFVFHNQENNIENHIKFINNKISKYHLNNNCVHTSPTVRGEEEYQNLDVKDRRRILLSFITFVKKCKIQYKTFYVEKKHIKDSIELTAKLSKQISQFIKENLDFFNSFDDIKIYYDNGQIEITRIISTLFNAFFTAPIFKKVLPSEYKLFQAADLFCYLTLLSIKLKNHTLSLSETRFFETEYNAHRSYIKQVSNLIFKSKK